MAKLIAVAITMKMTRSQLNIRIDSKLLSALQARAKSDGIPLIDWVTNALLSALNTETSDTTPAQHSAEALEAILERLSQVENYQQQCESYFPSVEKRLAQVTEAVRALQLQTAHRSI